MGRGACLKKFFQKRREEVRAGQGVPPINREDGMQVTLEEALTFAPSFGGKLNSPDDPLLCAHIDGFGWCAQAKGWKKLSSKLYGFAGSAVSSLKIKGRAQNDDPQRLRRQAGGYFGCGGVE
jgi:hypothetical protein